MNDKIWQKFAKLSEEMSRLRKAMDNNSTGFYDATSPLNVSNDFDQTTKIVENKRKLQKEESKK